MLLVLQSRLSILPVPFHSSRDAPRRGLLDAVQANKWNVDGGGSIWPY